MKKRLKSLASTSWAFLQEVPGRLRTWASRPWAVRKLFWKTRRRVWKEARSHLQGLRKYEDEFRLAADVVETFPDLVRHSTYRGPVRLGYGIGSLNGVIVSLKIEEHFWELEPLVDWLHERGYTVEKYDDRTRRLRRYRLLDEDRRVRGYLMANLSSDAACEVIEKKAEVTEYEIVCEGEAAFRGPA
ncbi:MAG: hypothetical protein ACOC5J_03425 [Gemmatimonadota bacterium]